MQALWVTVRILVFLLREVEAMRASERRRRRKAGAGRWGVAGPPAQVGDDGGRDQLGPRRAVPAHILKAEQMGAAYGQGCLGDLP